MLAFVNGKFLEMESAQLPAFHSGFYYGTGCFETMRADLGGILFFDDHYNRLRAGLRYLGVDEPDIPKKSKLLEAVRELLRKNKLTKGIAKVRIQCTLAEQNGYAPDDQPGLYTLISAEHYKQNSSPLALMIATTRVIPHSCRPPGLKLCNMLHYRKAFREAKMSGYDDAVMLTTRGLLSETSIANLFWKSEDTFFTPSVSCDLLPGISRKYFIKSLKKNSVFSVIEGKFETDHLLSAESVWVTNSLIEIKPVERIGAQSFSVDDRLHSDLMSVYNSHKSVH